VPVDERGNVKHPVDTDELILNVCNDKLGLDINLHDIGKGISWTRFHKGLKISLCYKFAWFSVRQTLKIYKDVYTIISA
jgi:hypothetical protein